MNKKTLIEILGIIIVISIGATLYFVTSKKQIEINQPAVSENSTASKVDQNTITEQDLADLKVVLEKEQPEYVSAVKPTWTIEVGAKNGRYIRATLYNGEFIPSYPSFYAYKADDGWKIIFSGQETPDCSKVNALNFPNDIITECFDGNKTIQR